MTRILTAIIALLVLAPHPRAARSFATSTDVVTSSTNTNVDFHAGGYVACGWANPTATTHLMMVIAHGESATSFEWYLGVNAGAKVVHENQNSAVAGLTSVTLNAWNSICAAVSGSSTTVYLNGSSDQTQTQSGTLTHVNNNTDIGGNSASAGNNFTGSIAEVAVWNDYASRGIIVQQFNAHFAPSRINTTSLVTYVPVNGQSPEPNWWGPFPETVTGTTITAHPQITR
jgi:hypothetical protein